MQDLRFNGQKMFGTITTKKDNKEFEFRIVAFVPCKKEIKVVVIDDGFFGSFDLDCFAKIRFED